MKHTNTLKRLNAVMKDINGDNTQFLRTPQDQIVVKSFICRPPSRLQKGEIGGMTGNKEFTHLPYGARNQESQVRGIGHMLIE